MGNLQVFWLEELEDRIWGDCSYWKVRGEFQKRENQKGGIINFYYKFYLNYWLIFGICIYTVDYKQLVNLKIN